MANTFYRPIVVSLAVGLLATACTVGPNYKKPPVTVPPAFKEAAPPAVVAAAASQLAPAQPRDAVARGKWWETFGDGQLNGLEEQVAVSNQTIAQAEARFRAARAAVLGARSGQFPTVTAGAATTRSRASSSRSIVRQTLPGLTVTDYQLPIDASWEVDLWGRVRRGVESSVATAQASAAPVQRKAKTMPSVSASQRPSGPWRPNRSSRT